MIRTSAAAIAATALVCVAGASVTNTFDNAGDVVLSPTQSAGTWYTDRYAPGVFAAGQTGGGRNGVLQHGVRTADAEGNRPGGLNGAFYNTQGRKYDIGLSGAVQRIGIDMYVDSPSSANVSAGLWATGFNGGGVSAYPIIAFRQSSSNAFDTGFYFFDTLNNSGGGWLEVSTGLATETWNSLEIVFTVGAGYELLINGMSMFSYTDTNTLGLDNVILNQFNFGSDQDVYWDNFFATDEATVIPLPTAGALAFAGVIGLGVRRRRIA